MKLIELKKKKDITINTNETEAHIYKIYTLINLEELDNFLDIYAITKLNSQDIKQL
jgi:hypothetical protein